jgi:hypothetical protein
MPCSSIIRKTLVKKIWLYTQLTPVSAAKKFCTGLAAKKVLHETFFGKGSYVLEQWVMPSFPPLAASFGV